VEHCFDRGGVFRREAADRQAMSDAAAKVRREIS
jgi:hypothetical protein